MYSKIVLIYLLFIFLQISCSVSQILSSHYGLSDDELLFCKLQPNGYGCSLETSTSKIDWLHYQYLAPWMRKAETLQNRCFAADVDNYLGRTSPSDALIKLFYFDTVYKTCSTFEYGECDLSQNHFNTLHECNTICQKSLYLELSAIKNLTADLICRLQPDFGKCHKYFPMYYFDVSTHSCKGFSYSGCGGNDNKFATEILCKETCTDELPHPRRVDPNHLRVRVLQHNRA